MIMIITSSISNKNNYNDNNYNDNNDDKNVDNDSNYNYISNYNDYTILVVIIIFFTESVPRFCL